jgi:hypothetical protein
MTFVPEIWSAELLTALRRNIFYGDTSRNRLGHSVVTKYSKAERKARKQAIKQWQQLTDELLAKGWLEDDYEEGIFPVTAKEHTEWVYDETVEEHAARLATLPPLPATVRIPILNDENRAIIAEHTS